MEVGIRRPVTLDFIRVKLVMVGDRSVGRTALVTRHLRGTYRSQQFPILTDHWMDRKVVDGTEVDIELWDVSDGDILRPVFSGPDTDVFLMCFAIDNPTSFLNVKGRWYYCQQGKPILLVGTKEDLRNDSVVVGNLAMRGLSPITYQEGLECARDIGAVKYMECSALTNMGVHEVFLEAVMIALRVREAAELQRNSRMCNLCNML